ncbi:DUF3037 domain-containing protein [Brevibacillus borstelensis]|uniref:DUF3037 domain-containing protein n=1 Tax=Brevibacillus borstelensis TaxID=45462 RepID=UPI0030C3D4F3
MAGLTCKFVVVKYMPSSIKQEVVNIGVIIHSPALNELKIKFLDYDPRVKHFLSEVQYAEFRAFRRMFNKHIRDLKTQLFDPLLEMRLDDENYLEKLHEQLVRPFFVTKPQIIFCTEIDLQLENLYSNLVLNPDEQKTKQKSLIKQVEERFVSAGIDKYLERDILIKNMPFELHVEFGLRQGNGLDLLQPISLQESPRENYKEGVFWRDAIQRAFQDGEINASQFIAILKPPKHPQRVGFSELVKQLEGINNTVVVNYNTNEFEMLLFRLKNENITRAL